MQDMGETSDVIGMEIHRDKSQRYIRIYLRQPILKGFWKDWG